MAQRHCEWYVAFLPALETLSRAATMECMQKPRLLCLFASSNTVNISIDTVACFTRLLRSNRGRVRSMEDNGTDDESIAAKP